ncbi:hypothetical protein NUW54_g4390 [Trametes sanguinea]|uniref:Uncharacterized protein n=1 Tax=Trametes sanguinea TaxID=158606 RepID=A0ACC1Q0U7_9APHY|nr:hypothetical protein NUW54_g4390 [Trametes sanguinea]
MASFATDPGHAESSLGPDAISADRSRQQSVEQNHSGAGEHDTDDGTGKRKKGTKRRKVNHACLYCRRSHMTCDEGRPCQRWYVSLPAVYRGDLGESTQPPTPLWDHCSIKREIGHLCHDERRSTAKEKAPTGSASTTNPALDVTRGLAGQCSALATTDNDPSYIHLLSIASVRV